MHKNKDIILPPAMLGILGGGQLGMKFTIAAKQIGYRVTVLDPDPYAPAAIFADVHICKSYDDVSIIDALSNCAAITIEFENVSTKLMEELEKKTLVVPSAKNVVIAQNRILEKQAINQAGLKIAPYFVIEKFENITEDCELFIPGILKTATLGYDGKGQIDIKSLDELKKAFLELKEVPCVLEKFLDLKKEISVIVCRLNKDKIRCFPLAENIHKNSILAFSSVPAKISKELTKEAYDMAIYLANKLDYQGVLTVEMFIVGDNEIYINEIAPRPHNSGHYTLDACETSQFEQQVRLLCGLDPADNKLLKKCCMSNILGDVWGKNKSEPDWYTILRHENIKLHLYGKTVAKQGRKMGHFTVLDDDLEKAYNLAKEISNQL